MLANREGTESFRETRLILLGDKAAGKTTFARRFKTLDAQLPGIKESTPGVDFHAVKASGIDPQYKGENDHTINIWDFAGHTVTHAAHKFFLSERAVYVIVLRGRTENGTTLNEWLEHIKYYTGKSAEKIKVYILVNKSDENVPQTDYDPLYRQQFDIERPEHIDLKNENTADGTLDVFRKKLTAYIVGSPYYKSIPSSILDIKEEISRQFESDSLTSDNSLAPKADIAKIIRKHMPNFNIDDILHILHSYGICFYYDKLKGDDGEELKSEDIVLNPRWATYVIYRLINFINNDKLVNAKRIDGRIQEKEYKKAFSDQTVRNDIDADYTEIHSKIVVLVKGNDAFSCEFGAELVADIHKVILSYNTFQEDKPTVKLHFTDKNGRNKDFPIEEILEEGSLAEMLVNESAWVKIKNAAIGIALLLNIEFEGEIKGSKIKIRLGK